LKAQIWLEDGQVSSGLRGFAPSREPVTLREDAIISAQKRGLSFRTVLCTVFSITSGDTQAILYDSDIRLHLPKLELVSNFDAKKYFAQYLLLGTNAFSQTALRYFQLLTSGYYVFPVVS